MEPDIQVVNGNCIEVINQQIAPQSIDLIVTDPPYNIAGFMKKRSANVKYMRDNVIEKEDWDADEDENWLDLMCNFFTSAGKVLKPRSSLIIFTSSFRVDCLKEVATERGFYYKTTGIWHKTNPMPRNMNIQFVSSNEPWIYFTYKAKTSKVFNNNGKCLHDFIEYGVAPQSERTYGKHPTQKPEAVMKYFIETLSNEGDTVLDPFMGSGTTGVVAKKLNRNFIGVELNPTYFEFAVKRIEETPYSE